MKKQFWENFFKSLIKDDKLCFSLYISGKLIEGADLKFLSLEKILNPDYDTFSIVKEINRLYLDCYGGSSSLASTHSHYQNNLYVMAAIYDCACPEKLKSWEFIYDKKHENDFKLTCQK